MINLYEQAKKDWIKKDYAELDYLKKQLPEFNKLYLRNFDKPLWREAYRLVIEDIKNELGVLNARLRGNQVNQRSIRYCLAGNQQKAG